MGHFVTDSYNGVMNARYNPLRFVKNKNTRHLIMVGLASLSTPFWVVRYGRNFQARI